MSGRRIIPVSLLALVCLAGLFALDYFHPFAYTRAHNLLQDAITRAGRKAPPNDDLVFLAIDSDSVSIDEADIEELYGLTDADSKETRALRLMAKRWPWSREIWGLVLERLVEAGAKVVMFDLTFPTSSENDEPFRLALERYKDHVVIGSNFVDGSSHGLATTAANHTRPPETLVPQTTPMDDRVAFTNFWPDEDDVVRRAQYRVTFEQVQGNPVKPGVERFLSLGSRGLLKAGLGDRVPDDLDSRRIRFTAPPKQGFRPHSIFEIFVPEYWAHNFKSGEFFRDKIVIVGQEGNWNHDEHGTPFGSMPGPELHLNVMNAAIHREFINEASPRDALVTVVIAAFLAIGLSLALRSPWLRLGALLAADAAAVWIVLLVFNRLSTFLPAFPFLVQLNATVLVVLVRDFASERVEKQRVRRTLEKYVSNNIVTELLDKPQAFQQALGGVIKPAAILFSDIRGYSTVSARTDPQALVLQLNEYLGAMVDCVFRYGGTLDKFIGDAVMAVWGNVRSDGPCNDATNAVRAALEMQRELARLNVDWRRRGLPELRVGVAINHGDVVAGNIGSPRRMEFTVIGDAVNVSWKLQELTKQVDADLVVSKTVAGLVVEHFEMEPLGKFDVRGFQELFEIFAISRPIGVTDEQLLETFQVH